MSGIKVLFSWAWVGCVVLSNKDRKRYADPPTGNCHAFCTSCIFCIRKNMLENHRVLFNCINNFFFIWLHVQSQAPPIIRGKNNTVILWLIYFMNVFRFSYNSFSIHNSVTVWRSGVSSLSELKTSASILLESWKLPTSRAIKLLFQTHRSQD